MKTSARNAAAVLGIGILGCVGVAVIQFTNSSPVGNDGLDTGAGAGPANPTHSDAALGKSGGETATPVESEPAWKTKSKERPSSAELARKRLEKRRIELVEALEKYKEVGLAGKHPTVVKAMEDLKKIEAEQEAVAGDGDKSAN